MWVGTTVVLSLLFLGLGYALRLMGAGSWVPSPAFWIHPASILSVCVVAALRRIERKMLENLPRRSEGAISGVEIRAARDGRLLHCFAEQSLRGLSLRKIDLQGACLWGEDLSGVDLSEARLEFAVLRAAILDDANLQHADLRSVTLEEAQLHGADLRGADLRGANLTKADLRGAIYDQTTRWPADFRPAESGCFRASEVQLNLPIPVTTELAPLRKLPLPCAIPGSAAPGHAVQTDYELSATENR